MRIFFLFKNAGVVVTSFWLYTTSLFAQSFTITDLGSLGGTTASAFGINNLGQIVGSSTISDGTDHAFVYQNGVMQDLGTPGVASRAFAINNSGLIVGNFTDAGQSTAGIWNSGILTAILGFEFARDVNSSGQVLVGSGGWNNGGKAAIYLDGVVGPLLGLTDANEINDQGTVVGTYRPVFRPQVATVTNGILFDPNLRGFALGINNAGDFVGQLSILTQNPGFFYQEGVLSILNDNSPDNMSDPYSRGEAINNLGQVVGQGFAASYNTGTHPAHSHAFIWANGSSKDLNDHIPQGSGWDLLTATGINDLGQIIGFGEIGGNTRAYLLTPVVAPEPSSLALLGGLGVVALAASRRRLRADRDA